MCTSMDLAQRRLTLDFIFLYFSGGGMNCVSCDIRICVYHLGFVCVFSLEVFLSSRVT